MKTLDDEFPSDPTDMFLIENNKDLGVEDFSD
jgi:hypothetical protein